MSDRARAASSDDLASTVLPRTAEVIRLPTAAKPDRKTPRPFTKVTVRSMHCPKGRSEVIFWDPSCRGFGLRALKSGRRSWVYQYRDAHQKTRRIALGDASAVSLEAAREAARGHAATVTRGGNPSVARKSTRSAARLGAMIDAYLKYAQARQRPRSFSETERHLRKHALPLHHEAVEAIGRKEISNLLEDIAESRGTVAANRTRATLSALWSWGMRSGLIEAESNPVAFTLKNPERARERVLSDAELIAVWQQTNGDDDYSRIVRLCILTGGRRDELGSLQWDEVGADRITISANRMKGNTAHEIAITSLIADHLPARPSEAPPCVFGRMRTGFSGWSRSKEALDARLAAASGEFQPWTLHDLRRTFSTRLHDAGIDPLVVEALLAHKQQGVAAVYNRAAFRELKYKALTRWHEILLDVLRRAEGR